MIFYLWRILFGGALSVASIKGVLKSKIIHKKFFSILICLVCILVTTVTAMFPVENMFVEFNSPEDVFRYTTIGNIEEVLHGQCSSLVIYKTDKHTYSKIILPKTATGYKIPTYFTTKQISQKLNTFGVFITYRVLGTQDYYILATIPHRNGNEMIEVYSPNGAVIETNIVEIQNTYTVYVYLQNFTNEHYIILNGEKIALG